MKIWRFSYYSRGIPWGCSPPTCIATYRRPWRRAPQSILTMLQAQRISCIACIAFCHWALTRRFFSPCVVFPCGCDRTWVWKATALSRKPSSSCTSCTTTCVRLLQWNPTVVKKNTIVLHCLLVFFGMVPTAGVSAFVCYFFISCNALGIRL